MIPSPWSFVESWRCIACGICCRGYQVVLRFNEWVNLIRKYGIGVTQPGVSKFFLGKKGDGTCVFLSTAFNTWLCGLQNMKPKACKIWPFKVLTRPRYGRFKDAEYRYRNKTLYVYVDPACIGLRWGKPTREFVYQTLPEFIEITLGLSARQTFSTSRNPYR